MSVYINEKYIPPTNTYNRSKSLCFRSEGDENLSYFLFMLELFPEARYNEVKLDCVCIIQLVMSYSCGKGKSQFAGTVYTHACYPGVIID